jgi:hypothetical protein
VTLILSARIKRNKGLPLIGLDLATRLSRMRTWSRMRLASDEVPFRTVLSDADYAKVRRLGDEYMSRNPRCLA